MLKHPFFKAQSRKPNKAGMQSINEYRPYAATKDARDWATHYGLTLFKTLGSEKKFTKQEGKM